MNNTEISTPKPGDDPSPQMTAAFVRLMKADYPELWDRLKLRQLDIEARADEYMSDPDGFVESDRVIDEIAPILWQTFSLTSVQLTRNLSAMLDIALAEAEEESAA